MAEKVVFQPVAAAREGRRQRQPTKGFAEPVPARAVWSGVFESESIWLASYPGALCTDL